MRIPYIEGVVTIPKTQVAQLDNTGVKVVGLSWKKTGKITKAVCELQVFEVAFKAIHLLPRMSRVRIRAYSSKDDVEVLRCVSMLDSLNRAELYTWRAAK